MGPHDPSASTKLNNKSLLDAVHELCYLRYTIKNDLSLEKEITKRIGMDAWTLARLSSSVLENNKNKDASQCVLSSEYPIVSSRAWNKKLNVFHLHCLHFILKMTWQDRISKTGIISCSGLPVYTPLSGKAYLDISAVWRLNDFPRSSWHKKNGLPSLPLRIGNQNGKSKQWTSMSTTWKI